MRLSLSLALVVSLTLNALHALKRQYASTADLAKEAIEVEQNVLKETVGIQDQIECAHGGLNLIEILRDGSYTVRPIISSRRRLDELAAHCMLFFTGLQRTALDIADAQVSNASRRQAELHAIQALVPRAIDALTGGTLEEFGILLHESWALKRTLADTVSNATIDAIYDRALDAGAIGGKLLGAGSVGFMLIFCVPQKQSRVRVALYELLEVPVRFTFAGTELVLSGW